MSLIAVRRGGGATPTQQSISITPNDDTVSVNQGSTVTVTYTLTRAGGYTGTVTPAVTGLPTGVTGGWSDSSLTGADSTTTLTLTAAADAPSVSNDAFTVTFSGSGVSDATDNGTVTVVVPTSFTPNLPSGMTLYGSTIFDPGDVALYPASSGAAGLYAADFEAYGDQMQATVGGQPSGHGTGAWEIFHIGNSTGDGYGPGNMVETTTRNYKRLYFATSVYFPSTYRCHSYGEKFTYFRCTNNGSPVENASIGLVPTIRYPLDSGYATTIAHCTDVMAPDYWMPGHPIHGGYDKPWNLTSVRIPRDVWTTIEVDSLVNTPGNSDGHVKMWVDGQLCMNETNICWHYSSYPTPSANQTTIDAFRLDFTRGGGSSTVATPSAGQSYYYGRLEWYGIV